MSEERGTEFRGEDVASAFIYRSKLLLSARHPSSLHLQRRLPGKGCGNKSRQTLLGAGARMGFSWGRAAKGCLVEQRGELSFQGTLEGWHIGRFGRGMPGWAGPGWWGGGGLGTRDRRPCVAGMAKGGVVSVCLAHWCVPSPGRGPCTQ